MLEVVLTNTTNKNTRSHEFIKTLLAIFMADGRTYVGRSLLNKGNRRTWVPGVADGRPFRLAAHNDAPSQWLGQLRMGVRSLVSGRHAVPNFSYASLSTCSVLGLQNGYPRDVQLLTFDFVRQHRVAKCAQWTTALSVGHLEHPQTPWWTNEHSARRTVNLLHLISVTKTS